jgi:thymidylate kinase
MIITFEGGEGVGKTSIINELINRFNEQNIEYELRKEIGGNNFTDKIKDLIINNENSILTDLFLVLASRSSYFDKDLDNKVIIYDRFIDSTAIYQGESLILNDAQRSHLKEYLLKNYKQAIYNDQYIIFSSDKKFHEGLMFIYCLHDYFFNFMPDKTFVITASDEVIKSRLNKRGKDGKFDNKPDSFHDNINNKFKSIAELFSNRCSLIDTSNITIKDSVDLIMRQIYQV